MNIWNNIKDEEKVIERVEFIPRIIFEAIVVSINFCGFSLTKKDFRYLI